MLHDALIIALVAYFVTSFAKYFVTFNMLPTLKLTILSAAALTATLAAHWGDRPADLAFTWLVACALATFLHAAHKILHAAGDAQRVATLRTRSRAR